MIKTFSIIAVFAIVISTLMAITSLVAGGYLIINLMTLAMNTFSTYNLLKYYDYI